MPFSAFVDVGELILINSQTEAKFTPLNQKDTGDRVLDVISSGDLLETESDRVAAELQAMHSLWVVPQRVV